MLSLELLKVFPISTIFTLFLSLAISLLSILINRLMVDVEKLRGWNRQISRWRSEYMKALKSKNEKKLEKLMKEYNRRIKPLTTKVMNAMLKTWVVSLMCIVAPLWVLIRQFRGVVVAYLPIGGVQLTFTLWYMICAFTFGMLVSKALGTSPY